VTTRTFARNEGWQAKLLCRRYLAARFDAVSIRATDVEGIPDNPTVVWAIGFLPDGTHELLGAWPVSSTDPASWIRVIDDLSARGLERVNHLWADEPFPAAIGWSDFVSQFGPFRQMSPRRRRVFRKFNEVGQSLRRRLGRAVARHGLFSGPQDVASFVVEALMRASNDLHAIEPLTLLSCSQANRVPGLDSAVSRY